MSIPILRAGILANGDEWTLPNGPTELLINNVLIGVEDAPTGTSFIFSVQNQAGATPAGSITTTIPAGQKTGIGTGALTILPNATIYFRVVQGSAAAWLIGYLRAGIDQPIGQDLASIIALKRYLGITDATNDLLLEGILTGVSEKIQVFIDRRIPQTNYTAEKHTANGISHELVLKHGPLVSVSEVRLDSVAVDPDDYELDLGARTVVALNGTWEAGIRRLEVDYVAGYAVVPADLQQATVIQAAWEFKRSRAGGDRAGLSSINLEAGGSTSYSLEGWAPGVIHLISKYRAVL